MQAEARQDRRSGLKRYGWIIVVAGIAIATGAYILVHHNTTTKGLSVHTTTVKNGTITQQVFSTGSVASSSTAAVYPVAGISGRPSIHVSLGQHVSKGQTLVTYPDTTLKDKVDTAQSVLNAQSAILSNAKKLRDNADKAGASHTSSAYIQLEQAVQGDEIQYQNALSSLKQAKDNVQQATLKSPISGTVIEVSSSDTGSAGGNGSSGALVKVLNLKRLEVDASLSQANAALISKGEQVKITSTAFPGKSWSGKVKIVSPVATVNSGGSANVNVKVSVPSKFPVHPGFNVNLTINAKTVSGLTIPYSALVENGNGSQVWVDKSGKAKLVNIKLGVTGNKAAQVTDGLSAGEKVIVNPPSGLVTGQDVSAK
ncbi:efflux RND transporter periplasmic adaptor subunit [Alicyclobacillus sp. SO9]|uniref:efflux RND transporter periplasmic adaptor subunit n=1 Tax=Alicyclobacillus sp. SO9 TaxID=2665646 RepID=UPI0018E74E9D|nr:efflux RND transporter periplasmic adaptor subunit [Alicyclobacillus sp. SO9]QQE80264.1 efflux RND transporter periplasmic adaptor subunit [Alicyclobacillus sp. SO9]